MTGASHERLETISTMKFSIIVPVYKVEQYLRPCIDSILGQTYKDFELILVDDGSPDACPQICDEYAEKYENVRCIHQKNGGLSCARNTGLSAASGEYVMFIDSDDYLANSNVLGLLAEKTTGNPDIVHYKNIEWLEADGSIKECSFDFNICTEGKTLDEIYCELIDKDAYYNSAWSKIIRREVLVENKIEFISGLLGEDNEWYYNVVMAAKQVVLVDEPLYVYRRRQSSITSSLTEKNLSDQLFVIAKWDEIIKREVDNPHIKVVRGSLAKQYCSALIIAGTIPDAKPYYAELRKYKHLLNYTKTRRVVIFRWIVWLLGVNGTVAALRAYKRIR